MTDNIHIRLSRTPGGVYINDHGSTRFYDDASWTDLCRMIVDFNATGVQKIQNYADLPTRTPLHANTPKPTLDDLV